MTNSDPQQDIDKRMRYFNGQFLQEEDFSDEQAYHLDRRRRHQRLLHTPGIAEGLEVTVNDRGKVQVGRGTAVDSRGRQIVLAQDVDDLSTYPVEESKDVDLSQYKGKTVSLVISYRQVETDPATVGGEGKTRIHECPEFGIVEDETAPEPEIALKKLTIDETGKVAPADDSDDVRVYAGLQVSGPNAYVRLGASEFDPNKPQNIRSWIRLMAVPSEEGTEHPGILFTDSTTGPARAKIEWISRREKGAEANILHISRPNDTQENKEAITVHIEGNLKVQSGQLTFEISEGQLNIDCGDGKGSREVDLSKLPYK